MEWTIKRFLTAYTSCTIVLNHMHTSTDLRFGICDVTGSFVLCNNSLTNCNPLTTGRIYLSCNSVAASNTLAFNTNHLLLLYSVRRRLHALLYFNSCFIGKCARNEAGLIRRLHVDSLGSVRFYL